MDESIVDRSTDAARRSERLESWKEIAAYLGRGVTTVQRWEQQEGLPVHRLPHAKKGSVFALRSELDAWRADRAQLAAPRPDKGDATPTTPPDARESWRKAADTGRWAIAIAGVLIVVAAAMTLTRDRPPASDRSASTVVTAIVARPLANDAAHEKCPSLSPDGSQVIYHWARAQEPGLYIKPVDGGPARRLPTDSVGAVFECGYPKWSPEGDVIAFLAGNDERKQVWLISPSGERLRRLTSLSGIGLCWAPDGQSLGFVDRNSPGEPFSIFAIPVHGGQRRRLTSPPLGAFGDTHCAFSPDGRQVALVRYPNRAQSDLFVTRLDEEGGDRPDRLTTGSSGMEGLDWSPDGRVIVFGLHQGLWKISVDAPRGRPTQIAAFEGGARYPSLSRARGGAAALRLVYESEVIDVNIWRWDVATGQATRLAGSTWWEDFPSISPDGKRVAFASNRTGANEIWTSDIDGSDPHQVTFHRGPLVTAPQWSPDGSRLAFSSQVGSNRDVYVIRPDGSESTRITTGPWEERNPSWSRDGRWLYFRSDQGGTGQIWKVPVSGGTPVRVTAGEASEGFESPDGTALYFVRSADTPGLWSVPVNGGNETLVLPDVREGWWGVADTGIYFLTPAPAGPQRPPDLNYFEFASTMVSRPQTPPSLRRDVHTGFAVARDGKFVVWTQTDQLIRDLMLIDSWKP